MFATELEKRGKLKIREAVWYKKQTATFFRCDRMRQAANMGMAEFSNIGCRGRDAKNTTPVSGMFDRYFVLRFLKWIKLSLEAV